MSQSIMQRQLTRTCTKVSKTRRAAVECRAASNKLSFGDSLKIAPAVLAAVIAANTGAMCLDLVAPRPVLADTEEENLSPYERRQRELERRRELLRQAREKAIQKAASVDETQAAATEAATQAVVTANESRVSEVSKISSELKASADSYKSLSSKNKLEPKAPEPAPSPEAPAPWWKSAAETQVAPVPIPVPVPVPTPAPAPFVAPTPAPAAEPEKVETPWWEAASKVEPKQAPEPKVQGASTLKALEEKKAAAVKTEAKADPKKGKRQGPLPGWLAQFLVLGALGGVAVAFTRYLDETTATVTKYTKDLEKALLELKVPNFGGN